MTEVTSASQYFQFALRYCVNLLSRREYSATELRNKMKLKQFPGEDIEQTITYCQNKNWQSDDRFCENYISMRSRRGYGPQRIKMELMQKGIPESLFYEKDKDLEINWLDVAGDLLSKKHPTYGKQSDIKLKQKIYRYMTSRGFNSDTISKVLNIENEYE